MKRLTKILLGIITVLILAVGLAVILQWDNVKTLYIAKTYSEKQIEEMFENDKQLRDEAVSDLPVRQLTDEEKNDIESGEMSSEEALGKILSSKPEEKNSKSGNSSDKKESESGNDSDNSEVSTLQTSAPIDYDAELTKLVGQMYVLEATYTGEFDNLVNSAIAEYKALPAEQHTQKNKEKISETPNKKIFIGKPIEIDEGSFLGQLEQLRYEIGDEDCDIRSIIKKIVPTYNYTLTGNIMEISAYKMATVKEVKHEPEI